LTLRLNQTTENDLINLGAGEEFTIRQFAEAISSIVGFDAVQIQYDTSRYVGAKSKCLDVTKLRKLVPDYKPTPSPQGLKQTIDWFANSGLV
jgi:GDP-L-fucose synthase